MNWGEIELKWGEMARRVQSRSSQLSPTVGLADLVEAVTSGPVEPVAPSIPVATPAE